MDEAKFTQEEDDGEGQKMLVKKYPPCALRNFFASVVIDRNKSPKFIKTVIGQEDIKTTLILMAICFAGGNRKFPRIAAAYFITLLRSDVAKLWPNLLPRMRGSLP